MKPVRITVDTTNLRGQDTPLLHWDDRQIAPNQAALEVCLTMRHVTAVIVTSAEAPMDVLRISIPAMSGGDHLAEAIESPLFKSMVAELCDSYRLDNDRASSAKLLAELERMLAIEVKWGECEQIHARGEAQYEMARERLRAKGVVGDKLNDIDAQTEEIKLMLSERFLAETAGDRIRS